jgi:hypothetical protein
MLRVLGERARNLTVVLLWSAVIVGVPLAAAGWLGDRDSDVELARQVATGEPLIAQQVTVRVDKDDNDGGAIYRIGELAVLLPGQNQWTVASNLKGYYNTELRHDPARLGWQAPLEQYQAPLGIHRFVDGHGRQIVMADEDIEYWTHTPWPHRWHRLEQFGLHLALLGAVGLLLGGGWWVADEILAEWRFRRRMASYDK